MEADVQPAHTTVLLHEAVDALLGDGVGPLACFVDATYGRGGHSALLLQRLPADASLIVADATTPVVLAANTSLGATAGTSNTITMTVTNQEFAG